MGISDGGTWPLFAQGIFVSRVCDLGARMEPLVGLLVTVAKDCLVGFCVEIFKQLNIFIKLEV